MTARLDYFLWALKRALGNGVADVCPACGGSHLRIVRRKYGVTALRECGGCRLRFRTPKDDPGSAEAFYVDEVYKQGFTTDLPSDLELEGILAGHFVGTELDFAHRIKAISVAGLEQGSRILDFGSSWGYGSWQLTQAGYQVYSYEIGRARANYAREKLKCTTVSDLQNLEGSVDCFFSSHVIEHLPNPNLLFDAAEKTLRPGGLLACFCPNGAVERERKHPDEYHSNWGKVHPIMLTPDFMKGEAARRGFTQCAVFSNPADCSDIKSWRDGQLEGNELLLLARWKT